MYGVFVPLFSIVLRASTSLLLYLEARHNSNSNNCQQLDSLPTLRSYFWLYLFITLVR